MVNSTRYRLKIGTKGINVSLPSVILFLYFTRTSFLRFAEAFGISTRYTAGAIIILWGVLLIFYSIKDLRNICWDGLALVLAVFLFFQITIIVHPEYAKYYENATNNGQFGERAVFEFGAGLYAYYHIRLLKDKPEELYRLFCVISYAIFFLNIWTIFFNRTAEYSMDFGYNMELAAILLIAQYLYQRKRKLNLILSLIAMLSVALYGARASFIGYVVFIAAYFIWNRKITWRKAVMLFLGVTGVIAIQSTAFLAMVYNLFSRLGFESRTLRYLAMGDLLAVDTARQDSIWPAMLEALNESGFFKMYGAYGDRQFVPGNFTYAHNFLIETLLTFGKFLGSILLIWMMAGCLNICRKNKSSDALLIIVFASFSLSRLFFSSSFWYEPYFWSFLAMLVNCRQRRKRIGIKILNQ